MSASVQEKISRARDAGYSDDEIVQFLGKTPDFGPKLKTAIDAGYKSDEILGHLSQPAKTSEGMPSAKRFDYASSTLEERRAARKAGIQGLKDVGAGVVTSVPEIGTNILSIIPGGERAQQSVSNLIAGVPSNVPFEPGAGKQAIRSLAQDVTGGDPNSPMASIARTGTQLGLTLGAPGAVARTMQFGAKLAPSASGFLTPAAAAIESGGFGAKLAENRLADLALRGLAGGASGAASMAPIDSESIGAGFGFGAALPTVLRPIAGAYKAVVPFVKDLFRPDLKAANIARQAAGPSLAEIQAAARVASPTETAGQAVAGVDRAQIQSLAEAAAQRDASNALRQKIGQQTAVEENTLARMAGGPTQTSAMQEAERMKAALNAQTGPMREQALGGANKTTATVQRAEEISKKGREFGVPPGESNAYLYPPGSTEREVALATAKSAEDRLAAIKAAGLEPLNVNGMVSSIEKKLSTPDIGIPDLNAKALSNVASKLREWSDKNGAITGEALYAIRKSAINDVIDQLMPAASQSAKNARAASVMTEVKPMIDNAIEKAGGKGWKDYLQTYEMGMRGIDQTKMAAQLMDLYRTNKPGFAKLVGGNDTAAVEAIFGPGSYDIVKEMGSKIEQLRPIASNIERTESMGRLARAGAEDLQAIIKANTSGFRIPSFVPKSTVPNAVLTEMQSRLSTKVLDQLERGFQSGASLNELLSKVPTQHRDFVARAIMRSLESMGGARGLPANMLAPSNQNALSQNQ